MGGAKYAGSRPKDSSHVSLEAWERHGPVRDIIDHYSRCGLTKPRDKLIAISSLLSRRQQRYKVPIWAGVIQEPAEPSLLWQAGETGLKPYDPDEFRAPSWSWASLEGAVTHRFASRTYGDAMKNLTKDMTCMMKDEWQVDYPVGSMWGRLSLSCLWKMVEAASLHASSTEDQKPSLSAKQFLSFLPNADSIKHSKALKDDIFTLTNRTQLLMEGGTPIGWMVFDTDIALETDSSESSEDNNIICVAICAYSNYPPTTLKLSLGKGEILDCPALRIEILALEVVPGMELYRRIGRGRIFREGWVKECETKEFVIV
jgi:hypothetical protein